MDEIELENAILEHLRESLPELSIDLMPDTLEFEFINADAKVLVRYAQTRFDTPQSGQRWQLGYPQVELTVYTRSLRDHQGAFAIMKHLRKYMTDFAPIGGGPPYIIDQRYVDHIDDVWIYGQVFEMQGFFEHGT